MVPRSPRASAARPAPGFRGLGRTGGGPPGNSARRGAKAVPAPAGDPRTGRVGLPLLSPLSPLPPTPLQRTARHRAGAKREDARRSMVGGWEAAGAVGWGEGAEPRGRESGASICKTGTAREKKKEQRASEGEGLGTPARGGGGRPPAPHPHHPPLPGSAGDPHSQTRGRCGRPGRQGRHGGPWPRPPPGRGRRSTKTSRPAGGVAPPRPAPRPRPRRGTARGVRPRFGGRPARPADTGTPPHHPRGQPPSVAPPVPPVGAQLKTRRPASGRRRHRACLPRPRRGGWPVQSRALLGCRG